MGEIVGYCYTLTSSNHKQKLHTISKNGPHMCKSNKAYTDLVFFCWFNRAHWARHTKWMNWPDDRTRIFGHSAQHIPVRVFIIKEDLDLLIEEKRRKRDESATFILAIYKLTSPTEKNLVLHQGNDFIDVYNIFFDKHYEWWINDILLLSISGTPLTASTFAWWYLGITEPDETELNIGMCEVHKCNVGTTRRRNFLD